MKLTNLITISGLPACGKSTLAKLLAKKYGYKYIYAGKFFRAIAKQKKMSLEDFEILCLKNPKYDIGIDRKMIKYVKSHKKVIYDGHISGWMIHKNKVKGLKLWLEVPKYIRAKRYASREKINKNMALNLINHREKFLKKRYKKLYNIDYYNKSIYDLIIDGKPMPKVILNNVAKTIKSLDK